MTSIRLLVGLSLALAGCYSPRFGSPGFYCHAEDNPACPPGQGCLAGRCVNLGQTPDGGHGLDGSTGNDAAPPLDFSGVDLAGADLKTSPDGSTVCALRINELQTAGSGGASDEFIELFSTCGAATLPNGYELVYRSASGTSDVVLVTFTGQSISSFFVCGQTSFSGTADVRYSASMAATGGGVALLDAAGYGSATNAFVRTTAAPAPASAQSIKRLPDGHDSGNNATDFTIAATPTPGAANQ